MVQPFPRRIFYVAWLLTLCLLLPACASDKDHAADPPDNILRIDVDCDFGPFCPQSLECSGSRYVFLFIYSFLCIPNPDGELVPDLAVSWDYDPNTFTWSIHLRPDARFHNGNLVTGADAAYSISAILKNYQKGFAQKIKSVKVVDDYLLEICLNQDDSFFLESIWDIVIVPDPGRHKNLDLNHSPIGSGPFKFVECTDDGPVILSANDQYYRGRPSIDQVVFYYIPERETSWVRLIKEETDIAFDLTVEDYNIIKQYADRFYFSINPYQYNKILLYNTSHPLFENPLVRRALSLAIDREYIVQKMLNGMAEVVAGPMGNKSVWHDPNLKPLPYDPPLALDLLEKAGWFLDPRNQYLMKDGAFFEFELLLPSGSETDLRIARFIKLQLNEVGIRVHLKAIPPDQLLKRYYQNREFDAVITELTASSRRPEAIFELWLKRDEKLSKAGGFDWPEAARLADLALNAKDLKTRKMLFHQFDHLIADLQPGTFLFQKIYIDAMSRRFKLNFPFYLDSSLGYKMQSAQLKNE